jgi:hypothetical protein
MWIEKGVLPAVRLPSGVRIMECGRGTRRGRATRRKAWATAISGRDSPMTLPDAETFTPVVATTTADASDCPICGRDSCEDVRHSAGPRARHVVDDLVIQHFAADALDLRAARVLSDADLTVRRDLWSVAVDTIRDKDLRTGGAGAAQHRPVPRSAEPFPIASYLHP